ncbi:MAG TPA: 2-oxoacid:acceptor oxidoreductase subunit alpha [Geobacter sp.]|nr:2-oxoacid:acceptor oxidoreductase subunit alpha [Geobacter sp.]
MQDGTPENSTVKDANDLEYVGKAWQVTYKDVKHAEQRASQAISETIALIHADDTREITLVISGEAGQGLQTIAHILARMFMNGGLHVLAVSEFMSRIRGGSNSVTLRAAHRSVRALNEHIDLCVLLDKKALQRLRGRCAADTILIGDPAIFVDEMGMFPLPLKELSANIGGAIYNNSLVCGYITRLIGWELSHLEIALTRIFTDCDLLAKNCAAARVGWEYGVDSSGRCSIPPCEVKPGRILLDGSQAVALGAVAGGCTFISSYPMSPSTEVLTHLAKLAHAHGIIVEQAEDEISAINMGLGSWYAGGRAMVSTSGGGFDLMAEGLSLCGAIESPMVIHLAQRPGPGTGLPTRTEQADLEIARYSGHGEFPRAILAPGSPEEAFTCTAHAFTMADLSQSPVIILTDQYLLDTLYDLDPFELPDTAPGSRIIATTEDYRRYAPGPDGISPRGIPGLGAGRVCVDSDEHDDEGCITEDFDVRISMVDKRLSKLRLLREDLALPPRLYGPAYFKRLIVGWGSTAAVVAEALEQLQPVATSFLHCIQIYPVSKAITDHLHRAKQIIVIENNATGQFARLLKAETGCTVSREWHKYNGLAFSVDEVVELLRQEVEL